MSISVKRFSSVPLRSCDIVPTSCYRAMFLDEASATLDSYKREKEVDSCGSGVF